MRKEIREKGWNDLKTNDSWATFKILSEFVMGFERMSRIGPCVSIFGSARLKPDNEYYQLATEVAEKICENGYGVITGGGPGIMEAGNKGAHLAGGTSVGLNIALPFEQHDNPYIDSDKSLDFDYFFARKVMFVKYSQGFVVMPGGFGTLDELFEAITLIQTKKIGRFPIILMGSEFWEGLLDWIKSTLDKKFFTISPEDIDLLHVVDTSDEAVKIINDFYNQYALSPNF
ncbi:LOG family protein [Nonlabens ponticola]|uniref:Cytokinin riboside 5'-monophosphate phosphoribohydrolase n=1 Tax=Nonlabens ponticola TaxID=2496866 RepID=A0A3S9MXW1_9FLAO|nr:TIGR00730 family Rossman fold protein [Nonlabens ponticola]AZQ44030.1 TIGR00730 family Rossman fold protein [Nonlabens ponticola]